MIRTLRYLMAMALMSFSCWCFSDSILIFGNDQKPPKNYLVNDQAQGIIIDIMRYADARLNQSFEYRLYPWSRAYRNTLEAKGGLIGLSRNDERLKILDYSDVMYYEELLLVVLRGSEFNYEGIDDLQGKLVGLLREAHYGDDFEDAKGNGVFQIEVDTSPRQRLLKLLHGRIDVAIIGPGRTALRAAIEQDLKLVSGKDKFVVLEKPLKRDPNYLGFAKAMQMSEFLEEFNRVIQRGYESGDIQEIIARKRD